MRETIAELKLEIASLKAQIDIRNEYLDKHQVELDKLRESHKQELDKVRSTTKDALRLNHRLATRNDALQWALYMAQMVARSVQEKLEKCEALVKVEGDKLSIAS